MRNYDVPKSAKEKPIFNLIPFKLKKDSPIVFLPPVTLKKPQTGIPEENSAQEDIAKDEKKKQRRERNMPKVINAL